MNSDSFKNDLNISVNNERSTQNNTNTFYSQASSSNGLHGGLYSQQNSKDLVWTLQELLEIILLIIENAQLRCSKFLKAYDIHQMVVRIYHMAKAENLQQIQVL